METAGRVDIMVTPALSNSSPSRTGALVLLAAIGLAVGCTGHGLNGPDPVAHATYFVVNHSSDSVTFSAVWLWSQDSLEVAVPIGLTVEVDRVSEGSGGHTFPSNFYESYTVKRNGVPATRQFTNEDWQPCGSLVPDEEGREELCLEVQDADFL